MSDAKLTNKSIPLNFYDDDNHFYEDFWEGRDYEHLSEVVAINSLLKKQQFKNCMDYGGGYGRLAPTLLDHVSHLTIVDPSTKQLNIAKRKFIKFKSVSYLRLDKINVVPADDASLDLFIMVRVSHHLIDPSVTFMEIARVLSPHGKAIIEIANYGHFKNRLKHARSFQHMPTVPVAIGKNANGIAEDTPFVNHNMKRIDQQLKASGLKIVAKRSVSNLRSGKLKQTLPIKRLIKIEQKLQKPLAPMNFGPSMFLLVEKK